MSDNDINNTDGTKLFSQASTNNSYITKITVKNEKWGIYWAYCTK